MYSDDIAFAINVSGPGVPPFEQIIYQRMRQALQRGFSDAEATAMAGLRRARWRYFMTGDGYEAANELTAEMSAAEWFEGTGWSHPVPKVEDLSSGSRAFYQKPFLGFDPAPIYASIRKPVLIIYGDLDWQIPVEASVREIEQARSNNVNADITMKVFQGTGHGLMVRGDGNRLFFKPGYHELMLEWLSERVAINIQWPD